MSEPYPDPAEPSTLTVSEFLDLLRSGGREDITDAAKFLVESSLKVRIDFHLAAHEAGLDWPVSQAMRTAVHLALRESHTEPDPSTLAIRAAADGLMGLDADAPPLNRAELLKYAHHAIGALENVLRALIPDLDARADAHPQGTGGVIQDLAKGEQVPK